MEVILSMALLLIGIAVLFLVHSYVVRRAFRGQFIPDAGLSPAVSGGMRPEDIDRELPRFDYKPEGNDTAAGSTNGGESVSCAVCLEGFKNGEKCRLLPKCDHSFHSECIDSWLLKTAVCPICRMFVGSSYSSDQATPQTRQVAGAGADAAAEVLA